MPVRQKPVPARRDGQVVEPGARRAGLPGAEPRVERVVALASAGPLGEQIPVAFRHQEASLQEEILAASPAGQNLVEEHPDIRAFREASSPVEPSPASHLADRHRAAYQTGAEADIADSPVEVRIRLASWASSVEASSAAASFVVVVVGPAPVFHLLSPLSLLRDRLSLSQPQSLSRRSLSSQRIWQSCLRQTDERVQDSRSASDSTWRRPGCPGGHPSIRPLSSRCHHRL